MGNEHFRKTIFVNDLQEGQKIRDLYLISRKTLAETKNGKPYLALSLMDKTGEIEARIWDNASHIDAIIETGLIVLVEAQVKAYRNQLQLNIFSLSPVEDSDELLGDFIPASKRSVREMQQELADHINKISDHHLQQLLESLLQGDILKQFSKAPAAKHMHHAYLGGLLEHTLSVTGLAIKITLHYPSLDRDLLISGAILHDLGKIEEFSFSSIPFDYTDSGRLIGHLVLGSEMVRKQANSIEDFPKERLDQLVHLILSHHGRHEFGAPCLPMTAEAILLHHLDDMDAKVNFIDRLSEQVDEGEYQWSDYQRTLERFLLLRGASSASSDQDISESFSSPLDHGAPDELSTRKQEQNDSSLPNQQGKLF